MRLTIEAESGDGAYQSIARRGYQLHFHGIEGPVTSVWIDGKTIPRAEMDEPVAGSAVWSTNEWSGDVLVSIPASLVRTLVVEFATGNQPY